MISTCSERGKIPEEETLNIFSEDTRFVSYSDSIKLQAFADMSSDSF